jgi:hypothetical protein
MNEGKKFVILLEKKYNSHNYSQTLSRVRYHGRNEPESPNLGEEIRSKHLECCWRGRRGSRGSGLSVFRTYKGLRFRNPNCYLPIRNGVFLVISDVDKYLILENSTLKEFYSMSACILFYARPI